MKIATQFHSGWLKFQTDPVTMRKRNVRNRLAQKFTERLPTLADSINKQLVFRTMLLDVIVMHPVFCAKNICIFTAHISRFWSNNEWSNPIHIDSHSLRRVVENKRVKCLPISPPGHFSELFPLNCQMFFHRVNPLIFIS